MAPVGKKMNGLIAATFTPMTENGSSVNLNVIPQYVDYLSQNQKIRSIFVNGTTGEGISLCVQERMKLTEEWVKHGRGKFDNVVVHVGCLSLEDSKELAAHAASCGADAISAVSPSFLKPSSPDDLVLYLKEVAGAAPNLPFYYYHIPSLTGLKFSVCDLVSKMKDHIPSFRGVKFSDVNLLDFSMCIHKHEQFDFYFGVDEQLLGALVFGAHGAVGSTYNYLGATTNKMLAAFEEGNLKKAREIQHKIQEFVTFVFASGWGLAEFKNIMSLISGIDLGSTRLPLSSSWKAGDAENVRAELKRLDFI
ncbi:N-acetylneuraminate lyase [Gastrophryne carolinensis]